MIVVKAIDKIIYYFLVLLMAVMSILGVFQVVGRLVGVVPSWTEEAIRFLFIWASCVGAAIGIKEHIHIGKEQFPKDGFGSLTAAELAQRESRTKGRMKTR